MTCDNVPHLRFPCTGLFTGGDPVTIQVFRWADLPDAAEWAVHIATVRSVPVGVECGHVSVVVGPHDTVAGTLARMEELRYA